MEKNILETWANDPYITCEDVSKCGQCLRQQILSEVAKERLQSKEEFDKEDIIAVTDETRRQWQETPLFKRVRELLQTKTLDQIRTDLEKEGIQI